MSDQRDLMKMDMLRFITAGSVDDGKSTLIGRLLYDTKSIFEDQLEAVERSSQKQGADHLNLALLTDGLRSEREQGITIDVAYRYFSTPKRKFILADAPGHAQYTRNMVTGASTVDLALVLIDARHGMQEQTRRHSLIASLLGIDHLLICINKMDLTDYSEDKFLEISKAYTQFAQGLQSSNIHIIPMSALQGDNVVRASENMPWYKGPTLLEYLEQVIIVRKESNSAARLPVQCVLRPAENEHADSRYYAGRMAAGSFVIGDEINILPEQVTAHITGILQGDKQVSQARFDASVAVSIDRHIDIGRGSMLVSGKAPFMSKELELMLCWMAETPLQVGKKYLLKHCGTDAKCVVQQIISVTDTNTLEEIHGMESLKLNDLGRIKIKVSTTLCYDLYRENRVTGSLILIDEHSNITVGAGMIIA